MDRIGASRSPNRHIRDSVMEQTCFHLGSLGEVLRDTVMGYGILRHRLGSPAICAL